VAVGDFVTGNLPKDVVTFIGVWSDTAFDRVEIVDLTGNDDDEYFGRFYTGTIAAAATVTAIASTGGAVPGGTGVFAGFPRGPALGGSVTAFLGLGAAGQQGLYSCGSGPVDPCHPLADLTTLVPGGAGAFTGFSGLAVAEDVLGSSAAPVRVAFIGSGVDQQGVYGCLSGGPVEPCLRIADRATPIPDGSGAFTGFGSLAVAPRVPGAGLPPVHVSFIGSCVDQQGVYGCFGAGPTDPCLRIADRATAIPNGSGTFTGFASLAVTAAVLSPAPAPIHVAFIGSGDANRVSTLATMPAL
jgi:hypothetical protein